jgi:hypothetical protein
MTDSRGAGDMSTAVRVASSTSYSSIHSPNMIVAQGRNKAPTGLKHDQFFTMMHQGLSPVCPLFYLPTG